MTSAYHTTADESLAVNLAARHAQRQTHKVITETGSNYTRNTESFTTSNRGSARARLAASTKDTHACDDGHCGHNHATKSKHVVQDTKPMTMTIHEYIERRLEEDRLKQQEYIKRLHSTIEDLRSTNKCIHTELSELHTAQETLASERAAFEADKLKFAQDTDKFAQEAAFRVVKELAEPIEVYRRILAAAQSADDSGEPSILAVGGGRHIAVTPSEASTNLHSQMKAKAAEEASQASYRSLFA